MDDKFINIFPVGDEGNKATLRIGLNQNIVDDKLELPRQTHSVIVGPDGKPGYNIFLTTDHGMLDVLREFYEFLDPESKLVFEAYSSEQVPRFVEREKRKLTELSDLLAEMPNIRLDHIFFTTRSDLTTSRVNQFWYHCTPPSHTVPRFALNMDKYDEEVLEIAYRLTNFPVNETEKSEIRELLEDFWKI